MQFNPYITHICRNTISLLFPQDPDIIQLQQYSPKTLYKTLPTSKLTVPERYALFLYRDPRVKKLIWEIKYRKNKTLIQTLSVILFHKAKAITPRHTLFLPVPQHKVKVRERGFNVSIELVKNIERYDTNNYFQYDYTYIKKTRKTKRQNEIKSKDERLNNLLDSFTCTKELSPNIQSIVLIDDVYTTGATINEIEKTIGRPVISFTVAH